MTRKILFLAAALLFASPALAQTQAYQGYSGPAAPASTAVKTLPPAAIAQPQAPAAPVVPPVIPQQAATPAPVDACAAYMSSYPAYTMCQDRMQKIQRMKDAMKSRDDALNPPPPPAPVQQNQAVAAPVTSTVGTPPAMPK